MVDGECAVMVSVLSITFDGEHAASVLSITVYGEHAVMLSIITVVDGESIAHVDDESAVNSV